MDIRARQPAIVLPLVLSALPSTLACAPDDVSTSADASATATDDSAGETGPALDCQLGDQRPCYTADDPSTVDVGLCHAGVETCDDAGQWGPCTDQVTPQPEDCATLHDEDCDGLMGGDDDSCECSPGLEQDCTVDGALGQCALGSRSCAAAGEWGPCESLYSPEPSLCPDELADGLDYDCNGVTSCGEPVWVKQFGGPGDDKGNAVALDADGNLWIGGQFEATVDFGGSELVAVDGADAFLVKLDGAGETLLTRAYGGASTQGVRELAIDSTGSVDAVGYFGGVVDFGAGPVGDFDVETVHDFVLELSADGEYHWSRAIGGYLNAALMDLAVDSLDGVWTHGFNDRNVRVHHFDGLDGTPLFAETYTSTGSDYGHGITIDADDRVLTTGSFRTSIDFGAGALVAGSSSDLFLAAFDLDHAPLWSLAYGGDVVSGSQIGERIETDVNGNIWLTGFFSRDIAFAGHWVVGNDSYDYFVAKLDPDGAPLWARGYGDEVEDQRDLELATDSAGNAVLAGRMIGSADFGSGLISSVGGQDMTVIKLDGDGEVVWSARYGDVLDQGFYGVAVGEDDSVFLIGAFEGEVEIGGEVYVSAGGSDVLVVKLRP